MGETVELFSWGHFRGGCIPYVRGLQTTRVNIYLRVGGGGGIGTEEEGGVDRQKEGNKRKGRVIG